MIIQTWTLKRGCTIELNSNGHYYMIGGKGIYALVNRLDCFVPSFQNEILREIGRPEVPMF